MFLLIWLILLILLVLRVSLGRPAVDLLVRAMNSQAPVHEAGAIPPVMGQAIISDVICDNRVEGLLPSADGIPVSLRALKAPQQWKSRLG